MMRRLVAEEARLDAARAGNARLGTKSGEVPGFMPAVNGGEDLEILLERPIGTPEFAGVVIPLHVAENVAKKGRRMDLRYELAVAGERWSDLRNRVPILVDPMSELVYLTKPTLRRRIADYPGAPPDFFSKMIRATTDSHAAQWRRAINDGSYLAALDWLAHYEATLGSETTLPLTTFVDGQSPTALKLAVTANEIACDFLEATNFLPGLYFSLNYPLFRRTDQTSTLIAGIRKLVREKAPYIIAIRLRSLPLAEKDDDDPLWSSLLGFLVATGGIASEYGVPFLLLNSGTYGFASLNTGVDYFSEPLNGNLTDPSEEDPITGKRKFGRGFASGKVYHPEYKVNLSRRDYEQSVLQEGGYPTIPGTTPPVIGVSDPEFRRQAKHYRVAARCEEARKFKVAIRSNEPRALAEEFARSRARNAERLIMNSV